MTAQKFRTLDQLPVHRAGASSGWNEQLERLDSRRARGSQRLVVDGCVPHPTTVVPSDLAALSGASITGEFCCQEGWYVPDLYWHGVTVATLLDAVGVEARAECIEVSAGAYNTLLSREEAQRALLALWLNDAPLPSEHGGPIRLIVPGNSCYTSVKWVDRVTVHEAAALRAVQKIAAVIATGWH